MYNPADHSDAPFPFVRRPTPNAPPLSPSPPRVDGKVAHADNAARVDAHPPLDELMQVQDELFGKKKAKSKPKSGGGSKSVVYWMRMEDVRGESDPF